MLNRKITSATSSQTLLKSIISRVVNFLYPPNPTPPKPIPLPEPPSPNLEQWIIDLLQSHNNYRAAHGKTMLTLDDRLMHAAQKHTEYMYHTRRMSHTGHKRSSHSERIKDEGYIAIATAENIAWGPDNVDSVMANWINSRGHRNNILSDNTQCGFGMWGNYWCVVFARPRST